MKQYNVLYCIYEAQSYLKLRIEENTCSSHTSDLKILIWETYSIFTRVHLMDIQSSKHLEHIMTVQHGLR